MNRSGPTRELGLAQIERPLSPLEKVMWRLSDAAPLNFTLIARIRGPLDETTLRQALDAVRLRHAYLQVRVELSKSDPHYRLTETPIPLKMIDGSADDWVSNVENELVSPIRWKTGPLVRCLLVRQSEHVHDLLVTLHHMIGDAMSGAYLIRDLLSITGQRANETAAGLKALVDNIPMDCRLPKSATGLSGAIEAARFVAGTFWEDVWLRPPAVIRSDAEAPPNQRQIRLISRQFDTEFTENLAARARSEGATVHAAISAAMILIAAQDIAGGKPVSLKHRSPVNMRAQLDPPAGEDLGLFASILFFRGRVSGGDDFWDLARCIRKQLKAGVARGTPAVTVGLLPRIYKLLGGDRLTDTQLAQRWRQRTPSTTGLTNLGRLDLPTHYGNLEAESLHFAISPGPLGDFACTATTFAGRLCWNFIFPEPHFGPQRRDEFAEGIVRRLQDEIT